MVFISNTFTSTNLARPENQARAVRLRNERAELGELPALKSPGMRTTSPEVAANRSERFRRQKRKDRLILIGVILAVAPAAALGTYLKYERFIKPRDHEKPPAAGSGQR